MANNFKTSKKTELVALRAAESAGYLTVGSRSYFKDQLVGKRDGQTYYFTVADAGKFQEGPDLSAEGASDLVEREVKMTLVDGAVAVNTNMIEGVTDVEWDKEVAQPNGQKLVNGIVAKTVKKDIGKQATAFVGEGFIPLAKASGHLKSIADEGLYGFIDPMIEAVLTSNGQQFVPVGAPEMYKSGLLGMFHGAEYRSSRFMPAVSISEALVAEVSTVTSLVAIDDEYATLTLAGVTQTIPAGTPIWVDGVYACDTVGDKTSALYAFIATEDAANGAVKVYLPALSGEGNKVLCAADGSELTVADFAGKAAKIPAAGDYFAGLVRVDGAMEFDTLDKIDISNAESSVGNVNGITVHENRAIDAIKGQNITRWDIVSLAGVVDPRAVALVLVKA